MSLEEKCTMEKQWCPQRYSLPTQDDRSNFGLADKNMFVSPTTVLSRCYFSPVSGAKPLKVCYHLVRWSFLLLNWFCGLKATRLLSILQLTQPDRTWCIWAHIFSLFSSKKTKGVSMESLLRGRSVKLSLKEKEGLPSLSFSLSPACALLTKAADRRVEINSMEPPDESKEEKEQWKIEKPYEDFTRQKSKITNTYWLVFHLCLHKHSQNSMICRCINLMQGSAIQTVSLP